MITTEQELRALYAAPGERAVRKQLAQLDVHCRRFIALSPFCVVSSAGVDGSLLDASPRGGAPGFVKVMDDRTVLLPDSGGNNRLDTLANLIADARIGLLFMVPGVEETLRINGKARLRDEAAFADLFVQERQRPKLVVEVQVEEAYLHCAKAFMRSALWQPATWPPREALPTMNEMIRDQTSDTSGPEIQPETQAEMQARYKEQLDQERLGQERQPTP